jgi:serine/threonine protein kinase
MQDRPEDVRGSREAPDQQVKLQEGDVVGGAFQVERYLGASSGGVSYLGRVQDEDRRVVIKVLSMPYPGDETYSAMRDRIRQAGEIQHRNLTRIHGMGRTEEGDIFVVLDYIDGETLSSIVTDRREANRPLDLVEVFHTIAHVCEALEAVHTRTAHGVLTPYNVYIARDQILKVGNLGFGRIVAKYLYQRDEGPFVESAYVPPEVRMSPDQLSPAADIYSLGMLTADMLSPHGLPADPQSARQYGRQALKDQPPSVLELVKSALSDVPGKRPDSAASYRDRLKQSLERTDAGLYDGDYTLPIESAVEPNQQHDDDDLFDIGASQPANESEERYLVRRDGLDYGPYTKSEVLDQLYDDEIDEHTSIQDRVTQSRQPLGEIEAFADEVAEYVPKRDERLRKERERRERIKKTAKQGGIAVLGAAVAAGVVLLGIMLYYYFNRPDPEPLPVGKAFASLDYKFSPPPSDFQTVSVDDDVLQGIFNPEASGEVIRKRLASAGSGSTAGGTPSGGGGSDDGVSTVDMSEGTKETSTLSDQQIYDIILSDFSSLRSCIQAQLDRERGFDGVHVKFFIRPSGTTGGVEIQESGYRDTKVGRCLVRQFRQMKFPASSAVSKRGVTFPLTVQRN